MNKKSIPHIIVVASYFYPKIGGLENYAYLLAKNLHESGNYTVGVITSNYDSKGYKREVIDGITVHRLPIWFKVSNTPINLFWYWHIKRIFKREQPSIVHVHSPVPYLPDLAVAAAKNIPVVLTYHSGSMIKGKWPIDILIGFYEKVFLKALFKRANAVVAVSQEFAKRVFPQFMFKTFFIPTGVDLKRFKKTPVPHTRTLTFVGRIEHSSSWKGIESLLQAMALVIRKIPEAKLQVVGSGDAVEHYRNRSQELGIAQSVDFPGSKLGQALVDVYNQSELIVLPSISDAEAFSIVLVEAMASGRPIIATNIGGNPQVVEHGKNGLLVPPNNPEKLAEAIIEVLENRDFAVSMGDYGALKAQNFSWDIQAERYSNLFYTLI